MSAIIGCHVSMNSPHYLVGSLTEAINCGANAFMIYTGAPQNTFRVSTKELKIEQFQQQVTFTNFKIENIFVHAPYILNLAHPDSKKFEFAVSFLKSEIIRTHQMGIKAIILHPGNALTQSREIALKRISLGLNKILAETSDVVICLETMSGKGTEVGVNFSEIKFMLDQIASVYQNRVGVCMDTCHLNDSGYLLKDFDQVLDLFDQTIGLNFLKVIHLNDSKNGRSSHKDRHENIGYGTIGFEILCNICHHSRLTQVPKILETPFFQNRSPYQQEIAMLQRKCFVNWRSAG